MRTINRLCVVLLFAACHNQTPKGASPGSSDSQVVANETSLPKKTEASVDTTLVFSNLKGNASFDMDSKLEVSKVVLGDDECFYMVVRSSTETCESVYLLLLDKHSAILKCVELQRNCDSDLSNASYQYKNMSQQSDSVFNIQEINQTVEDSSYIDERGHLKDGKSLDEVSCKYDTTNKTITFSLLKSGQFPNWPKIWK